MAKGKTKEKFDIFQAVTDNILVALDKDIIPWRKPWSVKNGENGNVHRNFATKKPYRGINPFLLEVSAVTFGYSSPYWLSYKQAKAKGGQVRQGEKGTLVVFWKPNNYEPKVGYRCVKGDGGKYNKEMVCSQCGDKAPAKVNSMVLKHYTVFNIEQCDGIEIPATEPQGEDEKTFSPLDAAEAILQGMPNPPSISYGGDRACYMPALDAIKLPERHVFHSSEAYYSTDFHERVHSTGHKDRLDRKGAFENSFGDEGYAKEELVAEMGAAMLCAVAGVENDLGQSASYIRHWMSKADYQAAIKKDKKLVVFAAARAQKAADHILGTTHDQAGE